MIVLIKNYMEDIVNDIYKDIKKIYNYCDNESFEHDVKTIALNNLPPAYFESDVDEGYIIAFLLDRQRRISVLAKVAEAADLVQSNNLKYK